MRLQILQLAENTASRDYYSACDAVRAAAGEDAKTPLTLPESKVAIMTVRYAKRYLAFVEGEAENAAE